jgi:nitroreductase
MELLQGIQLRRSIRAFKDTPIGKAIVEKIITAASNAPSYSNTQPWEITIITGETKRELARLLYAAAKSKRKAQPHLPFPQKWPEEMRKRSFVHMMKRWEAAGIRKNDLHSKDAKRDQFLQNFLFFNAPVVIIIYTDNRLGPWSIFDLGLFVQNLILSAQGNGLSTCIQAMPVGYPEIIQKYLGISSSKKIIVAVALGYRDKSAPINGYRSEKKEMGEWVNWLGFSEE